MNDLLSTLAANKAQSANVRHDAWLATKAARDAYDSALIAYNQACNAALADEAAYDLATDPERNHTSQAAYRSLATA
jgi:hypothetical protein